MDTVMMVYLNLIIALWYLLKLLQQTVNMITEKMLKLNSEKKVFELIWVLYVTV